MKSQYLILIIIVAVFAVGGLFYYSQSQQGSVPSEVKQALETQQSPESEKGMEGSSMGLGYMMKNGEMMVEENHNFSPMNAPVTLKDGTTVSTSGEVTKPDGSKITLSEGQSMWTDGAFMKEEAMMEEGKSDDSTLLTRYTDYSQNNLAKATSGNSKAVLFFAALKWCPSCQAADRDFKTNFSKVPRDVTILKVDYDTAKEMKQKYAITMQDTFVQVDSSGKEITRWNSGGQGTSALLANLK